MSEVKPLLMERETIIRFTEDDKQAHIYTHNARLRKKLMELCEEAPEIVRLVKQDQYAASFVLPKSCISLHRPYSEERKARDRERAKAAGHRPPKR